MLQLQVEMWRGEARMHPLHEPTHHTDDQIWIGWKWFEYHAKQRLESFKFFVTAYGATVALAMTLLQARSAAVSLALSLFSALLCLVFWQLDVRNRQLIGIGEQVLSKRWNELQFPAEIDPVAAAAKLHPDGLRYKFAFLLSFVACALFSLFMVVASVQGISGAAPLFVNK